MWAKIRSNNDFSERYYITRTQIMWKVVMWNEGGANFYHFDMFLYVHSGSTYFSFRNPDLDYMIRMQTSCVSITVTPYQAMYATNYACNDRTLSASGDLILQREQNERCTPANSTTVSFLINYTLRGLGSLRCKFLLQDFRIGLAGQMLGCNVNMGIPKLILIHMWLSCTLFIF